MASSEMSTSEFQLFRDGAIHFVCMGLEAMDDVSAACADIYDRLPCIRGRSDACVRHRQQEAARRCARVTLATRKTLARIGGMSDEAKRFRDRAKDCREIAATTHDDSWRETLLSMAGDFEEEAARLENEEAARRHKE